MQRALYTFFFYLAVPLILLRLYWRGRRSPAYRERIGERFGRFPVPAKFRPGHKSVWVHAVSVGEVVAAVPLVKGMLAQDPALQIIVTTMTPTGSARVQETLGEKVLHLYAPYDLPGAILRFLAAFTPAMLILMETELWPNIIHQCKQRGITVVLANGRMSARSARSYGRFPAMTAAMMQSLTRIFAQSETNAVRFQQLGANPEQVVISGSLKFHIDVSQAGTVNIPLLQSVRDSARPVVVAGSTREGEEGKVLAAFRRVLAVHPGAVLILVPRHPERFNAISKLAAEQGFKLQRRSEARELQADTNVIIGDSMGEMLAYYNAADVAFVGGSLVDTGCQNVLEPAALGKPVLVGPSQYNFADICRQMEEEGALLTVVNENELADRLIDILGSEHPRKEMARVGRRLIDQNQQALPTILAEVNRLLQE